MRERLGRGRVGDGVSARGGNREARDQIVAQDIGDGDARRAQTREERRQAIADPAQALRLASGKAMVSEDGAVTAAGETCRQRMLEIGGGERRQAGVGTAGGDQASERQRRAAMTAREDFEGDVIRQQMKRLARLEIDDEGDFIAARGKAAGEARPYPLRAAADQRMDIEQERARSGGRVRHRSELVAEFAARGKSAPTPLAQEQRQ